MVNYWDTQLINLLQYGFPLDFNRASRLVPTETNHSSVLQNKQHVGNYIWEELQFWGIFCPLDSKPLDLHVSPLKVRDKQDSSKKRTIMDLSWLKGLSVNGGVLEDTNLGTDYTLTSVDNITESLIKLGPAVQICKIDISRAFWQIKIDPSDIDLLGLKFENSYFLDRSIPLDMEAKFFRAALMPFTLLWPSKVSPHYKIILMILYIQVCPQKSTNPLLFYSNF